MKEIAAAVIRRDGRLLLCRRAERPGDSCAGLWEFPGGKMEPGETPEVALVREIREELDAGIAVDSFITTVDHDYEAFHLTMHCYLCSVVEGRLKLLEHSAAQWLDAATIDDVDWLPADIAVVDEIKRQRILQEQ